MGNVSGMRYGSMPRRYPSPMPPQNRQPMACGCASREERTVVADNDCASMVLAMAYVLSQPLDSVYEPENALMRGTLFPDLDKPLMVGGSCRG